MYSISYEEAVEEGTDSLLAKTPTFFVDCENYANTAALEIGTSSTDVKSKLEYSCASTKIASLFIFYFTGTILLVGAFLSSFIIYAETRKIEHYFRLSWIMSLSAASSLLSMYQLLNDGQNVFGLFISCGSLDESEIDSLQSLGSGFICAFNNGGRDLDTATRFDTGFELLLSASALSCFSSFIYWASVFANMKLPHQNESKDEIVA